MQKKFKKKRFEIVGKPIITKTIIIIIIINFQVYDEQQYKLFFFNQIKDLSTNKYMFLFSNIFLQFTRENK